MNKGGGGGPALVVKTTRIFNCPHPLETAQNTALGLGLIKAISLQQILVQLTSAVCMHWETPVFFPVFRVRYCNMA